MTITELKERAGCMAFTFAERAGYSRAYFDAAVHRGAGIKKARAAAIAEAIRAHIVEMEAIIAELHDDEAGTAPPVERGHHDPG